MLFVVGNASAAAEAPSVNRTVDTVLGAVLYAVPCAVMMHRPDNPIGWILGLSALGIGIAAFGSVLIARGEPLGEWLEAFGVLSLALSITVLPLLFPDGRVLSSRWRPVLFASVAGTLAIQLALLFRAGQMFDSEVENPLGVSGTRDILGAVIVSAYFLLAACAVAAFASLVHRLRRASGDQRQQILWVLLGLLFLAATVIGFQLPGIPYEVAVTAQSIAATAVLPACVGIALVRHRLLDIDVVFRRSLVYGLLWLLITLLYVGVAAALGVAAGSQLPVPVAVLLALGSAMLFEPARRRAQRLADRWVFGERPPDHALLATFSVGLDDQNISERLAQAVQTGLNVRWVRVQLDGQGYVHGEGGGPTALSVPVCAGGNELGVIECGTRETGRLGVRERNLVQTLATQTGLLFENQRLAARLVHAGEVERRRLERNLHDGTQQQLVALVAGLTAARESITRDAARAGELLTQLQQETLTVLRDVREIAHGIHPSVLTDGGLVEAVRERCASLPVPCSLVADEGVRRTRLPDEIEGAAYFCVLEAMANALKHGAPESVTVQLSYDGAVLQAEVTDDGRGFDAATTPRRGLAALADRAAALSGILAVASGTQGTRLSVQLPWPRATSAHG